MKGDEYFCKGCKMKWKEEKKGSSFCPSCYGTEIINLTRSEREVERKRLEDTVAQKRKEERLLAEKLYRRKLVKNREKKRKYYR